jgi:hypothetical protein
MEGREDPVSINDLTDAWLSKVLGELGDSHEDVAETLRNAQIKGRPKDTEDCPIARYIAARVREHLPSGPVTVTVEGRVYVRFGGDHDRMIGASVPGPVAEFIAAFDNVENDYDLYADLVEPDPA